MANEATEEEHYEDELPILPTVLENIIINYVYQLYHVEDFQECINEINDIFYEYYEKDGFQFSSRGIATDSPYTTECVEYYQRNNETKLKIGTGYYRYGEKYEVHN